MFLRWNLDLLSPCLPKLFSQNLTPILLSSTQFSVQSFGSIAFCHILRQAAISPLYPWSHHAMFLHRFVTAFVEFSTRIRTLTTGWCHSNYEGPRNQSLKVSLFSKGQLEKKDKWEKKEWYVWARFCCFVKMLVCYLCGLIWFRVLRRHFGWSGNNSSSVHFSKFLVRLNPGFKINMSTRITQKNFRWLHFESILVLDDWQPQKFLYL